MLLWQAARHHAQKIRGFTPVHDRGLADLVDIAERYGAIVYVRPMQRDVSGMILKNEGDDPEIFVNSLETLERQRFTLAHEIGHLVERIDVAGDPDFSFVDYRREDHYDLHEFFADEFAGELLMPAAEFLRVHEEQGDYGASVYFGVSVPAVRKRAQRLAKNPPAAAA